MTKDERAIQAVRGVLLASPLMGPNLPEDLVSAVRAADVSHDPGEFFFICSMGAPLGRSEVWPLLSDEQRDRWAKREARFLEWRK